MKEIMTFDIFDFNILWIAKLILDKYIRNARDILSIMCLLY